MRVQPRRVHVQSIKPTICFCLRVSRVTCLVILAQIAGLSYQRQGVFSNPYQTQDVGARSAMAGFDELLMTVCTYVAVIALAMSVI